MKNKLVLIFTSIPLLSTAHSGHQHHATDIIFHPLTWMDHLLFIGFVGIVFLVLIRKIMRKYFPVISASFFKKYYIKIKA